MSGFQATLEAFRRTQVLVIGDVMVDEYLTGDCSRLSPEAPVPIVAVGSSSSTLGGAANTAHNIASLGGQPVLVGLIGDDEAGRRIRDLAERAGIHFVPVMDGRPTVRKVRVLGQQQQLLRLDFESSLPIGEAASERVYEAVQEHLPASASVVVSDYAKGLLTESLCQRIIAAARAAGRPLTVDPRPQHAPFYIGCDYVTPNWKESRGLLGLPDVPPSREAILSTGRLLAQKFGARVLMTLGPKGMACFDRDGAELFAEPSIAREVYDVSGAGDTVVAAFTLAMAAGCSLRESVHLANHAAGLVVAKIGTATVTPEELLADTDLEQTPVPRHQLSPLAARLRAQGRKIATINGAFDILHAGHLHILREARKQADVLIVGLNSDRSVRSYKGPERPFIGEADRARMLLALKDVSYVHIFDEPVPMPFLEAIRPDVHVNGSEYGAECIEADTVRAHGGRVHVVERLPQLSTSDLLDRIRSASRAGDIAGR
jgi:D-beta-D-heptose 7-phosphate kinase/D-beta-D-heptose 1-phosphate adenosyltransferase